MKLAVYAAVALIAVAAGAPLATAARAQTPTPEATATPTAGTLTPTSSWTPVTPPAPVTETPQPEATPSPPAGMHVMARLPVAPGSTVTFDILADAGIAVCATAVTTEPYVDGASQLSTTVPPACGEGIVGCLGDFRDPCFRILVGEDIYAFVEFVPGGSVDVGLLQAIAPVPVQAPETGTGASSREPEIALLIAASVALCAAVAAFLFALRPGARL